MDRDLKPWYKDVVRYIPPVVVAGVATLLACQAANAEEISVIDPKECSKLGRMVSYHDKGVNYNFVGDPTTIDYNTSVNRGNIRSEYMGSVGFVFRALEPAFITIKQDENQNGVGFIISKYDLEKDESTNIDTIVSDSLPNGKHPINGTLFVDERPCFRLQATVDLQNMR